jgi:hypothetical protein
MKFIDIAKSMSQDFYSGKMDHNDKPDNAHAFNVGYIDREYLKHGQVEKTRRQHVFSIGTEFEQWVANNIHPFAYEAGLSVSVPKHLTFQGPHCDLRRRYVLNYIIDCGGENVRTQWWREKGYPLERVHESGPEGMGFWVKDYANLELIDDVVFGTGIWVLLNPKILHSVENITGYRTFLTVSLPDMAQFPWNNRNPAYSIKNDS